MLWLNQECECQKLDLEAGARDRVGPPLRQALSLAAAWLVSVVTLVLMLRSCEGVWLLLDLSLMSLPLARGSRHTCTGVSGPHRPPAPPLPLPFFSEPVDGGGAERS